MFFKLSLYLNCDLPFLKRKESNPFSPFLFSCLVKKHWNFSCDKVAFMKKNSFFSCVWRKIFCTFWILKAGNEGMEGQNCLQYISTWFNYEWMNLWSGPYVSNCGLMSSLISPSKQGEVGGGAELFRAAQHSTTLNYPGLCCLCVKFEMVVTSLCDSLKCQQQLQWERARSGAVQCLCEWRCSCSPCLGDGLLLGCAWSIHLNCQAVSLSLQQVVSLQSSSTTFKKQRSFCSVPGWREISFPTFWFFSCIYLTVLLLMVTCCRYSYLLFSACMLKQCLQLSSSYKGFCEWYVLHILWSLTCSTVQEKGWVIFKEILENEVGEGLLSEIEGLQGRILNYTHSKRKKPWRSLSQAIDSPGYTWCGCW